MEQEAESMSSWRVTANRIVGLCATLAALALVGCGGTTKTVTTTRIPGATAYKPPPPATAATYTVTLASTDAALHAPKGAPGGSGIAVLTLDPASDQLCWTFSQLKNVTAPRIARIYQGFVNATGMHGRPLGDAYKPSGCLSEPAILFRLLEAHPERFYVAIFNAKYPEGAVRGQL